MALTAAERAELAALEARFANEARNQQERQLLAEKLAQPPAPERSAFEDAVGIGEAGLTIAGGVVREPLSGLAGVLQSANPFASEGAGADAVEGVREALTYQPRTEAGQEALRAVGDSWVGDVGEFIQDAEQALGQGVMDLTGSPAAATAAHTLPTTVLTALGYGGAKGAQSGVRAVKDVVGHSRAAAQQALVPTREALRQQARGIYQALEQSGMRVPTLNVRPMLVQMRKDIFREGGAVIANTPAALRVFRHMVKRTMGKPQQHFTLAELEGYRKAAKQLTLHPNKAEADLGQVMVNSIDDFYDKIQSGIGDQYGKARGLWRKARSAELLDDALERAGEAKSGLENGIRNEVARILRNDKLKSRFTDDELAMLRRVSQGEPVSNMLRFFGRLGGVEGQSGRMNNALISAFAGGSLGAYLFGPEGALISALAGPAAGQTARNLARGRTLTNLRRANEFVRSPDPVVVPEPLPATAVPGQTGALMLPGATPQRR